MTIDTSELPTELLAQLKLTPPLGPLAENIIKIVDANDGPITLDEILVALWRIDRTVHVRRSLQNKLWKMSQDRRLKSVTPASQPTYTMPDEDSSEEKA